MNKIKTGVIGYGFSGKIFQCPFIEAHEAFELAAVVQRHGDTAKEDYPNISLYRDYKDMIKDETIDLVVVSTPAHLHFEQAKAALEMNKHVLIEKPFATSLEEATALQRLAAHHGKLVIAYQNRRFDGDFLTIKKIVEDPNERVLEFDAVWDRNKPDTDDSWHETGLQGCGLLYDLGPHYLDQALALFGEPEAFYGVCKMLREGSKVIDYFNMTLAYSDKVVRLKSTLSAAKEDIRYKLHTNKGTYHFYEMGEQEHQLIAGMKPNDPDYGDNAIYDFYDYEGNKTSRRVEKGNYLEFYTQLSEAILKGGKPPVTTEASVALIGRLDGMREKM